jgi:lipopolysaccharide transport system permease protein
MKDNEESWDIEVTARQSLFSLRFSEVWRYRDLLLLFVKRDFASIYKQTILGPLWFFIQPMLTAITMTIVFGRIAQLPTAGYPKLVFYLSGITAWTYFSECLVKTSSTFVANQSLFGKVYFPRIIVPLSVVVSNVFRFGIQLLLLSGLIIYYNIAGTRIVPNEYILLFPLLLVLMAALGLGFGMFLSSLTTKYRDLQFLITFGVSLLMYLSPVIFPLATVNDPFYRSVLIANPMTSIIETFRYAVLGGQGEFTLWMPLAYTTVFTIVLFMGALFMFNRVQRSFMDTV